jgi:nucleotide-binding universal stress UspA family protein
MAVLVPYDGSMPAQQAVEYAVETADEQLVLLRVVEAASGTVGAGIDLLQESLKKEPEELRAEVADEVEDTLDQSDIAYEIETTAGKPDREIVAYAEKHDIDQIVMGSHGRTGTSRILLGSVAETVVRRAPVTVTVVR